MKNEYYNYSRDLERELCCEMEKWNCGCKTPEVLHNIKDLLEAIALCQEKEAGNAMREYFEDEHGYDSYSGEFREEDWEEPFYGVYNAAGRRGGRRRDSRGRYMSAGEPWMNPGIYTTTGMNRSDGNRRGGRGSDGRNGNGRGGNRGSNGSYNYYPMMDNNDYQMNDDRGTYMRSIYNHADHEKMEKGKVKKLTDEEYKEWVKDLVNSDGSTGETLSMEETTSLAKKVGVDFSKFSKIAWWATCNIVLSDYAEVFSKYDISKPDVVASFARAWLEDEDGLDGEEKLSVYKKYIAD